MSEGEKEALRKLIMLISDLRAKDEERYEAHVDFMNETIKMIRAIESQMNKHWEAVLDTLKQLNENISANLDSLLTGINPKGLRETSKSLGEIMDTMNKSIQSMNLEKVLSELKVLKSTPLTSSAKPKSVSVGQQPEPISADINLKKPSTSATPAQGQAKAEGEDYEWEDPHEKQKREEEEKEEEPHLLKPSDFFGGG